MKADKARAISDEAQKEYEKEQAEKQRKYENEAKEYAEMKFSSLFEQVLVDIKKCAQDLHFKNETSLCVKVQVWKDSGDPLDGELRNKLLADKMIFALEDLGYEVVLKTISSFPEGAVVNDYTPSITSQTWRVKW